MEWKGTQQLPRAWGVVSSNSEAVPRSSRGGKSGACAPPSAMGWFTHPGPSKAATPNLLTLTMLATQSENKVIAPGITTWRTSLGTSPALTLGPGTKSHNSNSELAGCKPRRALAMHGSQTITSKAQDTVTPAIADRSERPLFFSFFHFFFLLFFFFFFSFFLHIFIFHFFSFFHFFDFFIFLHFFFLLFFHFFIFLHIFFIFSFFKIFSIFSFFFIFSFLKIFHFSSFFHFFVFFHVIPPRGPPGPPGLTKNILLTTKILILRHESG